MVVGAHASCPDRSPKFPCGGTFENRLCRGRCVRGQKSAVSAHQSLGHFSGWSHAALVVTDRAKAGPERHTRAGRRTRRAAHSADGPCAANCTVARDIHFQKPVKTAIPLACAALVAWLIFGHDRHPSDASTTILSKAVSRTQQDGQAPVSAASEVTRAATPVLAEAPAPVKSIENSTVSQAAPAIVPVARVSSASAEAKRPIGTAKRKARANAARKHAARADAIHARVTRKNEKGQRDASG